MDLSNGVRADKVDWETLQYMKKIGFTKLAFGVEAGNNKVLRNLRKSETIETIEESIKSAIGVGFDVTLFFLIGSPGETSRDVQDSINLVKKYRYYLEDVRFYNLFHFPVLNSMIG